MKKPQVYIIAGEPSGDILASRLMCALQKKTSDVTFEGVGGETMKALGFQSLFNIAEISVMGMVEILPRLRLIFRRINQTVQDIKQRKPDVVVTVDSWGFVEAVLKKLKKQKISIPKIHYVAPQVWAWKKGRAKKVPKLVNRLITLLPFEPAYFEKYGLKTDFAGHPVIESTMNVHADAEAFRKRHRIPDDSELICLLPGSRHSEISRLLPVFKDAARRMQITHPNIYLLIPTVDSLFDDVSTAFSGSGIPYAVVRGQTERYEAFNAAKMAIAASGTVSLELATYEKPHLIAYTFSKLTNFIARILITLKYVNLLNILADREIIPEFLGTNCNAKLITSAALELLENEHTGNRQIQDAKVQLRKLQINNILPSDMAAEIVWEEIKARLEQDSVTQI